MKIWIDITNSPHVNFFRGMVEELRPEHEVLVTCRPLANTIDLLDLVGIPYHVVGRHYGRSSAKKVAGFGIRVWQLVRFLRRQEVDVAISHSSFYSPLVSRLLGVPSIYLNDNEHAAGNRIAFRFADRIMVPEFLDMAKVERQGARRGKVVQYPGVKEGVYLWSLGARGDVGTGSRGGGGRPTVFIRPEPWTAQYYKGKTNFIDDVILGLRDVCNVVVLPRGAEQAVHYQGEEFSGVRVPDRSLGLAEIMERCSVFIGAGGTMTREAAVLGVPTISIYQDALLDVDRFLIEKRAMVHRPDLTAEEAVAFVAQTERRAADNVLLKKGVEAHRLIVETVLACGSDVAGRRA